MFYQNVGVPVRTSTKYVVISALLLLVIGMAYSAYSYRKAHYPPTPEQTTLSQQVQQLARPVVTMPANGDSVHVDQKVGYILIFTGSGFEHHVVYTGGRDCIVGNTKDPCQEGPILYQYVRDTTGKPNSATYRFVL